MYVKVEDGKPQAYSIRALRKDNPNVAFPRSPNAGQLFKFGVHKVEAVTAVVEPWQESKNQGTPVLVTGIWTMKPLVVNKSIEQRKSELAAYRYKIETGGVTVGGTLIDTSPESQQRIAGMWIAMQIDPVRELKFKGKSGRFGVVKRAESDAIATVVTNHVQACFNRESELSELLETDITTDITTGWPS